MKKRGFVLTDWNLNTNENYLKIMEANGIQFLAYGLETCPTSGKQHHQAFFYFYNPRADTIKNRNKLGKLWGKTHCFVKGMDGNFQQNNAYCSKQANLTKLGEEPQQGSRGDIKENIKLIKESKISLDELMLMDPVNYNQYKNTYKDVRNLVMKKKFRTEMTKGIWYWGKTGAGKSHKAFENYHPDTHFIKDLNVNWWDNYEQQDTVIINEFRGEIKFSELLDLVDKWPKNVPIRNSPSVPFTSKTVIITSSKPPEEIYSTVCSDNERLDQLERRFEIVKLEQKYSIGNIRTIEPKPETPMLDKAEELGIKVVFK